MSHRLSFVNPSEMGPPAAAYSHVVEAVGGRTLYLSGQVALDERGELVGPGDLRAQTEQVMKNIQAGLRALGGEMRHVFKRTLYLTDIARLPEARAGAAGYFDEAHPPASTAVEVRRLFRDEFLIEVEVIAVVP